MKSNADTLRAFLAPRGGMLIDAHLIEQVADLMHDTALVVKDATGRYVVVNQSIAEWHGLTRKSQILGRRPCEVCPGEFGRVPTEQDAHVLRTGRPIVERLELFWHRPHAPVWGLTSKFPIHDEAGRVTGLIGISKTTQPFLRPLTAFSPTSGYPLRLRRQTMERLMECLAAIRRDALAG